MPGGHNGGHRRIPLGVVLEVVGGQEPEHLGRERSMIWDAASRTPLPPIFQAGILHAHGLLTRLANTAKDRAGRLPVGKQPRPR
jgi:hypothetical protein